MASEQILPKHSVLLSEADVDAIVAALPREWVKVDGKEPLYRRMILPELTIVDTDGDGERRLTPAGRNRLIARARDWMLDGSRPYRDQLAEALRAERVADAYFTLSIEEGKPGPERNAAIERLRLAREQVDRLAVIYAGFEE